MPLTRKSVQRAGYFSFSNAVIAVKCYARNTFLTFSGKICSGRPKKGEGVSKNCL